MITIGINTASSEKTVCSIKDSRVVFETHWTGLAEESKRILPAIIQSLKKIRADLHDIDRVVVCSGPGSFSSVRIGVTIANALGYTLRIPVVALPLLELEKYAPESFGKVVAEMKFKKYKNDSIVSPLYNRPPNISKPKKPFMV